MLFGSFLIAGEKITSSRQCKASIIEGIELMNKGDYYNSIKLLSNAKEIAQKNRWHEEEFLALNNIGSNYYHMHDYNEALQHFTKAYIIASSYLNIAHELSVLNNISLIYMGTKDYNKALEYLLLAYNKSSLNKEKRNIYAQNLAIVYMELNEFNKSHQYLQEVLNQKNIDIHSFIKLKNIEAVIYLSESKITEALNALEEIRDKIDPYKYKADYLAAISTISKIQYKINNPSLAIRYANNYLSYADEIDFNKLDVFQTLSDSYYLMGDYETALSFRDSISKLNQALYNQKSRSLLESNKIKFELLNYEKTIERSQNQLLSLKKEKKIWILSSIIIIMFLTFSIYFIHTRNKARKINLLNELKEKEINLKLIQANYKLEKETQQRELLTKVLTINQKQQIVNQLIEELKELEKNKVDFNLSLIIKKLKKSINTENEVESYFVHFKSTNSDLLEKLVKLHPELTQNDLRFLAYIYINLSLKEVSQLLNISIDAAKKRNIRLKQKLNLKGTDNIYKYLLSLTHTNN